MFFSIEKVLNNLVTEQSQGAPIQIPGFSLYTFPLVWHNLTFLAGYFKIFLALIALIFVTNEFTYKTMRQNVMNGMSRGQFLASKVLFIFILSFLSVFILFLSGLYLGIQKSEVVSFDLIFEKIGFLPAYFVELFTFCSMALLIGFLVKNSGLAIGLLAIYYLIIEGIISYLLPDAVSKYLPVEAMTNIIDIPNSSIMKMVGVNFSEVVSMPDLVTSIVYSVVFIGTIFLILRRSDI
jgi:ABC-type transport system involved in multi-copper enzyme maturation permease subunit